MNSRFCAHVDEKMTRNLIKLTFLFVAVCLGMQLNQATSSNLQTSGEEPDSPAGPSTLPQPELEAQPTSPATVETLNLTPTSPLELNKIAFQSLVTSYDKVGPLIYTLLTEKNALGNEMGVVSEVIVDKIGLENYSEEMKLILPNLLNREVKEKISEVYDKIKDIGVENDPNRNLKVAVDIIKSILQNDTAVAEINSILKQGSV